MLNSRRDFLTAFKKPLEKNKEEAVLRPPYGFNESLFLSECPKCETKDCTTHCEEDILIIRADGTPSIVFKNSGCTFCEECAKSCSKGVLSLDNIHTKDKLNATFSINFKACMAHNKTICFSCKEPCLDDAILFNGMFNPIIDTDRCTGCGFCISRCPTNAIEYKPTIIKNIKEPM
jgi:ferredoxin-type protein NapF